MLLCTVLQYSDVEPFGILGAQLKFHSLYVTFFKNIFPEIWKALIA